MLQRIVQLTLILGVILGLLLPKTSAALSELGLINSRTVVICTGAGLQEITLSEAGEPVQPSASDHDADCLLVHGLDRLTPPEPPVWVALAMALQPMTMAHLHDDVRVPASHFARAPPYA
ncbi:hypothetical protein PAF17_00590 [Paracoccus sp. Z330]|uniref:DUF2946 domain-containing protein n=1 Tax=Paracoccus onchidii TaxID=3017813 RepID=A0ABT4Z9H9_9RHOB|nr:hypothetical protein [Paracoccus onchidii]MDB6176001.1 hypothetical protein [Paracoccus onchidii]